VGAFKTPLTNGCQSKKIKAPSRIVECHKKTLFRNLYKKSVFYQTHKSLPHQANAKGTVKTGRSHIASPVAKKLNWRLVEKLDANRQLLESSATGK